MGEIVKKGGNFRALLFIYPDVANPSRKGADGWAGKALRRKPLNC
jgi:hypothetical protein